MAALTMTSAAPQPPHGPPPQEKAQRIPVDEETRAKEDAVFGKPVAVTGAQSSHGAATTASSPVAASAVSVAPGAIHQQTAAGSAKLVVPLSSSDAHTLATRPFSSPLDPAGAAALPYTGGAAAAGSEGKPPHRHGANSFDSKSSIPISFHALSGANKLPGSSNNNPQTTYGDFDDMAAKAGELDPKKVFLPSLLTDGVTSPPVDPAAASSGQHQSGNPFDEPVGPTTSGTAAAAYGSTAGDGPQGAPDTPSLGRKTPSGRASGFGQSGPSTWTLPPDRQSFSAGLAHHTSNGQHTNRMHREPLPHTNRHQQMGGHVSSSRHNSRASSSVLRRMSGAPVGGALPAGSERRRSPEQTAEPAHLTTPEAIALKKVLEELGTETQVFRSEFDEVKRWQSAYDTLQWNDLVKLSLKRMIGYIEKGQQNHLPRLVDGVLKARTIKLINDESQPPPPGSNNHASPRQESKETEDDLPEVTDDEKATICAHMRKLDTEILMTGDYDKFTKHWNFDSIQIVFLSTGRWNELRNMFQDEAAKESMPFLDDKGIIKARVFPKALTDIKTYGDYMGTQSYYANLIYVKLDMIDAYDFYILDELRVLMAYHCQTQPVSTETDISDAVKLKLKSINVKLLRFLPRLDTQLKRVLSSPRLTLDVSKIGDTPAEFREYINAHTFQDKHVYPHKNGIWSNSMTTSMLGINRTLAAIKDINDDTRKEIERIFEIVNIVSPHFLPAIGRFNETGEMDTPGIAFGQHELTISSSKDEFVAYCAGQDPKQMEFTSLVTNSDRAFIRDIWENKPDLTQNGDSDWKEFIQLCREAIDLGIERWIPLYDGSKWKQRHVDEPTSETIHEMYIIDYIDNQPVWSDPPPRYNARHLAIAKEVNVFLEKLVNIQKNESEIRESATDIALKFLSLPFEARDLIHRSKMNRITGSFSMESSTYFEQATQQEQQSSAGNLVPSRGSAGDAGGGGSRSDTRRVGGSHDENHHLVSRNSRGGAHLSHGHRGNKRGESVPDRHGESFQPGNDDGIDEGTALTNSANHHGGVRRANNGGSSSRAHTSSDHGRGGGGGHGRGGSGGGPVSSDDHSDHSDHNDHSDHRDHRDHSDHSDHSDSEDDDEATRQEILQYKMIELTKKWAGVGQLLNALLKSDRNVVWLQVIDAKQLSELSLGLDVLFKAATCQSGLSNAIDNLRLGRLWSTTLLPLQSKPWSGKLRGLLLAHLKAIGIAWTGKMFRFDAIKDVHSLTTFEHIVTLSSMTMMRMEETGEAMLTALSASTTNRNHIADAISAKISVIYREKHHNKQLYDLSIALQRPDIEPTPTPPKSRRTTKPKHRSGGRGHRLPFDSLPPSSTPHGRGVASGGHVVDHSRPTAGSRWGQRGLDDSQPRYLHHRKQSNPPTGQDRRKSPDATAPSQWSPRSQARSRSQNLHQRQQDAPRDPSVHQTSAAYGPLGSAPESQKLLPVTHVVFADSNTEASAVGQMTAEQIQAQEAMGRLVARAQAADAVAPEAAPEAARAAAAALLTPAAAAAALPTTPAAAAAALPTPAAAPQADAVPSDHDEPEDESGAAPGSQVAAAAAAAPGDAAVAAETHAAPVRGNLTIIPNENESTDT